MQSHIALVVLALVACQVLAAPSRGGGRFFHGRRPHGDNSGRIESHEPRPHFRWRHKPSVCKFNSTRLDINYDVPCDLSEFFECVEGTQHHHGHHGWPFGWRPFGNRPGRPSGNRPGFPFGSRPGRPSGNRPDSPLGNRPVRPSGNRPDSPFGNRPGQPTGSRPGRPSGHPFGNRPGNIFDNRPSRPVYPFDGSRPRPFHSLPGRHHHPFHSDRRPKVSTCQLKNCTQDSECGPDFSCVEGKCNITRDVRMYAAACNVTNGEGTVVKERECLGRCGSRGHHISYGGENLTAYFCRPRGFTHADDDSVIESIEAYMEEFLSDIEELFESEFGEDWWPFGDESDWWPFGDDEDDDDDDWRPFGDDDYEDDNDDDWWNFGDDDNDDSDHTTPNPDNGSDGDSELPFSGEMGPELSDEP